ncbi:MAG: alpha/beta hydrolase [Acidimicrobiales bacterium]
MRRLALITTTALLLISPSWSSVARSTTPPLPSDGHGIHVDGATWMPGIDDRLLDVTVSSAALTRPAGVRVLVPASYRDHPDRRYPVLYLLHGGFGGYRDWTEAGDAQRLTAGLDLIVVMPDGGQGGWYADWYNDGRGGPPAWERFHIGQVVPWVDANFRTIGDRSGRAIAGLSMGGFGAMSYAARHPDLFASASSFSGAVDLNQPAVRVLVWISPLIDGGTPGAIFGHLLFDDANVRAHNPWDRAANVAGMHVALYTGNGLPGPLDPPGTLIDPQEPFVHQMNVALHERLTSLGIAHTWRDYGAGTHRWPYWVRSLGEELPAIMAVLALARDSAGG